MVTKIERTERHLVVQAGSTTLRLDKEGSKAILQRKLRSGKGSLSSAR
jgi:hypothetical protein